MIKRAYLFSGQGSQYPGMGRDIVGSDAVAAATFAEASEALGLDVEALCFDSSAEELAQTANTQPAILTYSVALYRAWTARTGIAPDVAAGHSLGEISALTAAGVLPFADAVRLARRRGQLMQEAVPAGRGLMLAVQTRDHTTVQELCERAADDTHEVVSISNYNSNTQVVVAGGRSAVLAVQDKLDAADIRSVLLNVSVPFHCALMEDVVEPLREELGRIILSEPAFPVLSNVTGRPYGSAADVTGLLTRQVVEPVRWTDDLRHLRMNGVTFAVEFGPGDTLTKFMRHTYSDIRSFSLDKPEGRRDVERMIERTTYPFVPRALGMAVATRNTNPDNAAYTAGVIEPYQRIRRLGAELEREGRTPTPDEARTILALLLTIFRTKGVSQAEQDERVEELIRDTRTAEIFADVDVTGL
ncbi:ACP S-malonyltransferase [Cryobacterium sp. 1639]|nr:ACP S-malonyltransferase [Cryobacterium sp. 1639]